MRGSTRRVIGVLVAAVGMVLVVVGAWFVVKLGPAGEAHFSATLKAPGAIVVTSDVLNAVAVPVQVTVTRPHGGAVLVVAAASTDARAIVSHREVSTVSAVHFPAGTLDLRASGTGALGDISTADVWRLTSRGAGSATLVVDQGRAPETAVVTSGDTTALTDVTVTLTWADRAWFFEALVTVMIGAVIAAFSLNDLWQGRAIVFRGAVAGRGPGRRRHV